LSRGLTLRVALNRAWARTWPFTRGRGLAARLLALPASLAVPREADGSVVRTRGGARFRVHADGMHDALWVWGSWDPWETEALRRITRAGDVAFDVGANFGWFTVALARWGARVHAFEPVPEHVEQLRDNLRVNGLEERVCVRGEALGEAEGTLRLHRFAGLPGGQVSASDLGRDDAEPVDVPLTTLDTYVGRAGLGGVDVLKIDVEGHEPAVFRGGERTLAAPDGPAILLEVNPECLAGHGLGARSVEGLLRELGYTSFVSVGVEGFRPVEGALPERFGNYVAFKPAHADRRADLLQGG